MAISNPVQMVIRKSQMFLKKKLAKVQQGKLHWEQAVFHYPVIKANDWQMQEKVEQMLLVL